MRRLPCTSWLRRDVQTEEAGVTPVSQPKRDHPRTRTNGDKPNLVNVPPARSGPQVFLVLGQARRASYRGLRQIQHPAAYDHRAQMLEQMLETLPTP